MLLPRNPFTEAAGYAIEREKALRVLLHYPDVRIDTNHLEWEIRPTASWWSLHECVGLRNGRPRRANS